MKPTVRLVVAIATLSLILAACGTASGTLGPVPTLTPTRPSAHAWRGVVPRPENGSRTTSPGRE